MVIGLDSAKTPTLTAERNLKGSCRALTVMGDYIVAALTKTVVIYQYDETSTTSAELRRVASYRPATYPIDVAVHGNIIAVADMMKSMTLIEFTPAADGQPAKLQEVSRHYQGAWATAVSHIDGSTWLEADAQGNLMLLERNEEGVTADDKKRMRLTEVRFRQERNHALDRREYMPTGSTSDPRACLQSIYPRSEEDTTVALYIMARPVLTFHRHSHVVN